MVVRNNPNRAHNYLQDFWKRFGIFNKAQKLQKKTENNLEERERTPTWATYLADPPGRPSTVLAHASQLLCPRQAGTEVTPTSTSSPRRHLLAARAPGHLGDLHVAAPTPWTPHSPPCLSPSPFPISPNASVATDEHHRGHRLSLAPSSSPESPTHLPHPLHRATRHRRPCIIAIFVAGRRRSPSPLRSPRCFPEHAKATPASVVSH